MVGIEVSEKQLNPVTSKLRYSVGKREWLSVLFPLPGLLLRTLSLPLLLTIFHWLQRLCYEIGKTSWDQSIEPKPAFSQLSVQFVAGLFLVCGPSVHESCSLLFIMAHLYNDGGGRKGIHLILQGSQVWIWILLKKAQNSISLFFWVLQMLNHSLYRGLCNQQCWLKSQPIYIMFKDSFTTTYLPFFHLPLF